MSLSSICSQPHGTVLRRTRRKGLTGCSLRPPAVVDRLEARRLLADSVFISEFLASNTGGLQDKDGDRSDWIELHNPTSAAVGLENYTLTDDRADLDRWRFPAGVSIPAGGYLVVF